MKEEKDIDQLFKDGLGNPEIPYNEPDWEALDEKLHPARKRRIVSFFWMTAAPGLAAMLIIVFVLMNNNTKDLTHDIVKKKPVDNSEKITNLNKTAQKQGAEAIEMPKTAKATAIKNERDNATVRTLDRLSNTHLDEENLPAATDQLLNMDLNKLFADMPQTRIADIDSSDAIAFKNQKINTALALPAVAKATIKTTKTKPNFILGITVAPDLTSVQRSGKSSLSGGIGMEATLVISKRLSITTGAAYAKKIYDSDFSLYNPQSSYVFKNQPSNIHAHCDVIDIPLNVNYKILGNNRNSLTVSTGLSSYLMLKEDYYYTYSTPNANWPQSYEVKNQNQHFFGIANIGIAFQHKISNKLSIGIMPFAKIPLTNIGYGNSKLSSTGVAVSINMLDLFGKKPSSSKP